jgi:hypothetical protein
MKKAPKNMLLTLMILGHHRPVVRSPVPYIHQEYFPE